MNKKAVNNMLLKRILTVLSTLLVERFLFVNIVLSILVAQ